jgi:ribA/ribD-fused uncharacterized protein
MNELYSPFRGDRFFLSNFYPHKMEIHNLSHEASTVEHAFQALKTRNVSEQLWVFTAATPKIAKMRGRKVSLDPQWDSEKVSVMKNLLQIKFSHPILANKLLETKASPLVEYNTWHDNFWGQCSCPKHRVIPGLNILGKLLTEIRNEL